MLTTATRSKRRRCVVDVLVAAVAVLAILEATLLFGERRYPGVRDDEGARAPGETMTLVRLVVVVAVKYSRRIVNMMKMCTAIAWNFFFAGPGCHSESLGRF